MFFGLEPPLFVPIWKRLAYAFVVASTLSGVSLGQTANDAFPAPSLQSPPTASESVPARIQGGLPRELVLPPPSDAAKRRASRFIEAEINPELPLSLVIGRPKILRLADTPKRIYVPNEDVIRAEAVDQQTGRELAVTGLRAGTTTLMLWFADNTQPSGESIVSYLVRVYDDPVLTRPLDEVERDLNQKFPNSFVQLSDVNGRLMVSGQARDAIEMSQILQVLIGARGVPAGVKRVSPVRPASTFIDFNNNETLDAESQEADNRSLVDPVALAQAGIVNLMRVPGEQQVMLRVTVAEVSRDAARNIGLNFGAGFGNGSVVSRFNGSGVTGGIGNGGAGSTSGSGSGFNPNGNVQATINGKVSLGIQALRQMGLARTLAEPNLVAINGQPANFQAGGQFPVPQLASSGGGGVNLQGVQFVPFGVQLRFLPVIQDRDVIRLQLLGQVSSTNGGSNVGNTFVPGLSNRSFSTTVELRSGQTLAVAGLLQTTFQSTSSRIPFVGDLPVIGWAAGTNGTTATEQELVILVTPELVAPVDSCEIPGLPGNDLHEPTDVEFFISNRLESRRAQDFRSPVRTDFHKQRIPDKCCPDRFIIGANGPTDRCCNQLSPISHQPLKTIEQLNSMPTTQPPSLTNKVSR